MRLDTLFIDEGFGSLDDQTLDEVLDVLDSCGSATAAWASSAMSPTCGAVFTPSWRS